jgi:hypothetical protein
MLYIKKNLRGVRTAQEHQLSVSSFLRNDPFTEDYTTGEDKKYDEVLYSSPLYIIILFYRSRFPECALMYRYRLLNIETTELYTIAGIF